MSTTATKPTATAEPMPPAPTVGAVRSRLGRLTAAARAILRVVGKAPMSLAFVAVLIAVTAVFGTITGQRTGRLLDDVGTGASVLGAGRWWTVFSYGLFSQSVTSLVATVVLALAILVPAERRLGVVKTLAVFAVCQVGGALLAAAAIELGALTDDFWLTMIIPDQAVGASVGIVGVGLALSASLTALWRRRLRLILIAGALLFMLYNGSAHDVMRMAGAVIGLVIGVVVWGRARGRQHVRAATSHAETRVLVALTAAAAAIGPLIDRASDSGFGPLATYNDLFVGQGPTNDDVTAVCTGQGDFLNRSCLQMKSEHLLASSPATLNYVVPAIILLILAEGLRRGRRIAWVGTILAQLGVAAITWRYAAHESGSFDPQSPEYDQLRRSFFVYSTILVVIPVAVIALLIATRRHFDVRSPRWTVVKLLSVVVGTFLVAGAVYIKFGYDARDQFDPTPSFGQLVADFPKRLVPPVYLALLGTHNAAFIPEGGVAKALYENIGPAFWLVTFGGLLAAFWRSNVRTPAGAQTDARKLLTEYGGSTLSFMTTWPGHQYWLSPDGENAVAYRVIGNIALTTGGPYGRPPAGIDTVGEFAAYCDAQGWAPCLYSVTEDTKQITDALGWSAVQVAEDTVLELPDLAFTGKKWQDIRTALNKAGKAGISAQWWRFPSAPLAVQEQVRELSEEWVADKGLPEMGFTLGGLDELDDPEVRCLVAIGEDGVLHGITSWLPCYRDGEPVGWTLDFMRRGPDGFRGVMEFLIASAALGFKEEGAEFLSLSGAPLARVDQETQPEGLQRLLDVMGRTLEPVYGFRSLLAFKAKFQPRYQPLYMTYADPAALPAIANAIGRAYLPHTTPGQLLRLSRRLMG